MGLGIVLLFWGVLSVMATAGGAVALAGLVYWIDRRRGQFRKRWLVSAAALPFLFTAYLWGAFAVYGVWCEVVRDVDLGIGDSWRVPLGGGYSLTMIDTPDQAFLNDRGGQQSHSGLKRIGSAGNLVAGEDDRGFFLLDSGRHTDTSFASEAELRRQVSSAGAGPLSLVPPEEFYDSHRWGILDGVAAALALGPPFAGLLAFGILFARSRSS